MLNRRALVVLFLAMLAIAGAAVNAAHPGTTVEHKSHEQ